jgi:hypothetical protein
MYNVEFFSEELSLIGNEELRDHTREILSYAPAWFWWAPASLTGLHHPPEDREDGGNCLHTAKVVWLAYKFFHCFDLDTDPAVVAGLTHDLAKYGWYEEPEEPSGDRTDFDNHPHEAANWMARRLPKTKHAIQKWRLACELVMTHMGGRGFFGPHSFEQKIFHLADVAASRRGFVALKFYDAENFEGWI